MVVSTHPDGVTITLQVQPRAPKTGIRVVRNDGLRLAVAAPPVDGAANKEVVQFLSKQLKVPKRDVVLISGERGRRKVILVRGATTREVTAALGLSASSPEEKGNR